MLARLHILLFIPLCLMASALGGFLAFVFLRSVASPNNPFADIILTLTVLPLSIACPAVVLSTLRRLGRPSQEQIRIHETRANTEFLAPEWAFPVEQGVGAQLPRPGYYERLGVEFIAGQADIEERYESLIAELRSENATSEKIQAVEEAYAVLGDPAARVKYDLARVVALDHKPRSDPPPANPPVRDSSLSLPYAWAIGVVALTAGIALTFTTLELIYGPR